MTDLRIWRGDSSTLDVAAVKRDGVTPQSIVGATLRFSAKLRHTDADVDAVISKSTAGGIQITDGLGGLATVTIDPTDTEALDTPKTLVWDVQMTASDGSVKTLAKGLLYVLPDVTRTS